MLIVLAPSSIATATTSAVNSTSERVASIGENSTSSVWLARLRDGSARLADHVFARRLQLVNDVDVGGRDERVDAGPLSVLNRAPAASISAACVRASAAMTGPSTVARSPGQPRSPPAR